MSTYQSSTPHTDKSDAAAGSTPLRAPQRARVFAVAAAAAVLLAGCASAEAATTGPAVVDTAGLTAMLTRWDTADSAASTKNDLKALAVSESGPALAFSVAGARAALLSGQKQASYQHVSPTFVSTPAPDGTTAGCVLASASIKLTGEELLLPDFSEFETTPTGWTLTNHVMLARSTPPGATGLTAAQGISTTTAVTAAQQSALGEELFGRTIGTKSAGKAQIAASTLVDRQLLGGWQVYVQQLGTAKMTATRSLLSSSMSPCAAKTATGTLVFLTMKLTDVVAPAKGGPRAVTLPATSPDLQSLGSKKAVSGGTITIARTESYLLQIPTASGLQVQVLGMSDAPTAITTT